MLYYFSGDKSRPADTAETSVIGIDGASVFDGRLIIPIEAETREEAWEKAHKKVDEYQTKTGVKVINLGWSETNHYGV